MGLLGLYMFGLGEVFKFKAGPGVVGRSSHVVLALIVAMCFFAWLIDNIFIRTGMAVVVILVALLWGWKAFDFSEKNPGPALTDGMELVKYRYGLDAKDIEPDQLPPEMKTISTPDKSPVLRSKVTDQ